MGQSAIPSVCLAALLAVPMLGGFSAAEAQSAASKQSSPSFDNRVFRSVLEPGDIGQDVKTLQIALDRAGCPPGPFDGQYGGQTETAVRECQQGFGLFPTGVADERLLDVLGLAVSNPLPAPVPAPPPGRTATLSAAPPSSTVAQVTTLRRGSQGERVRELQRALNRSGANLEVDGVFGANTEQALIRYQRQGGLRADGVAGSQTLSALGLGSSGPSSRRYLAAVPGTSNLRLARQLFGSRVYVQDTGRGDLVVIGAYSNRGDAQLVVDQALRNGLDNARVVFQ